MLRRRLFLEALFYVFDSSTSAAPLSGWGDARANEKSERLLHQKKTSFPPLHAMTMRILLNAMKKALMNRVFIVLLDGLEEAEEREKFPFSFMASYGDGI
jgi:hypothetical protein